MKEYDGTAESLSFCLHDGHIISASALIDGVEYNHSEHINLDADVMFLCFAWTAKKSFDRRLQQLKKTGAL